jgi:CheY-like chemotaxis protein
MPFVPGSQRLTEETVRRKEGLPMAIGSRILLADSSLLSRKIASAALVGRGFEVLEAENGEQALDLALSERPDLILLDLGLPGLSGYDVARHLRATPDMQHIPIIAVTGRADRRAYEKAQQAGIDDLIVKPVDRDDLVQIVTSILGYG